MSPSCLGSLSKVGVKVGNRDVEGKNTATHATRLVSWQISRNHNYLDNISQLMLNATSHYIRNLYDEANDSKANVMVLSSLAYLGTEAWWKYSLNWAPALGSDSICWDQYDKTTSSMLQCRGGHVAIKYADYCSYSQLLVRSTIFCLQRSFTTGVICARG